MPTALLIAFLVYNMTAWSLGSELTPLTRPLQDICVAAWAHEPLTSLGSAMICGLELPSGETKDLFLRSGLYHVLVVSGAHLVWLAEIVRFIFPKRPRTTAAVLTLFAVMTGLGAPLVRAGFQMLWQSGRKRPWLANIAGSYITALTFHPGWWNSVSLHLSALAALAMGLPIALKYRGLAVLTLTLPVILPFGSFTLLGAFTGLLLSPVVELVVFPVCVIAWLIPSLQDIANDMSRVFLLSLGHLETYFATPVKVAPILPAAFLAPYFIAIWWALQTFSARGALAR